MWGVNAPPRRGVAFLYSPPLFRGGVRGGVDRQCFYRFKPDKLQQVFCDEIPSGKNKPSEGLMLRGIMVRDCYSFIGSIVLYILKVSLFGFGSSATMKSHLL